MSESDIDIEDEVFLNTDYVEWLDKFTKDYPIFFDSDLVYTPGRAKMEDKLNVEKLQYLFLGIDDYAYENKIECTPNGFGEFYKLKYKSSGFEIGTSNDQEMSFFCIRNDSIDSSYIDFYDVMHDVEKVKVLTKKAN